MDICILVDNVSNVGIAGESKDAINSQRIRHSKYYHGYASVWSDM